MYANYYKCVWFFTIMIKKLLNKTYLLSLDRFIFILGFSYNTVMSLIVITVKCKIIASVEYYKFTLIYVFILFPKNIKPNYKSLLSILLLI